MLNEAQIQDLGTHALGWVCSFYFADLASQYTRQQHFLTGASK